MSSLLLAHPGLGAWMSGAATGLGLFAVVGAQSAFILRQGLRRQHIVPILATCAIIDAVFIFASVAGLQTLTQAAPWLATALLWAGVAFLSVYALSSAKRAWAGGGSMASEESPNQSAPSRRALVLAAAGFSIVNPHFWLDMVLIGTLADNFGSARMVFAAGVVAASLTWLAAQGLGARALAPWFSKPMTWRVLDALIAVVMSALAIGLVVRGL